MHSTYMYVSMHECVNVCTVCVHLTRNRKELSEPAQHLADNPPHFSSVCLSCGYLPLPVDPDLPHHQRQGTNVATV